MKIVVVGGGGSVAVATRFLTERMSNLEIDVFTKREVAGYRPCELTYVLGNKISDYDKIINFNAKASEAKGVKYHFNTPVLEINREEKYVVTSSGNFSYDKLILATGATPILPPIPGINGKGIYVLGTDMSYAKELERAILKFKTALIIGAGAIGLEMAEVLKEKGYERVIVADIADRPLAKSLDSDMAKLVTEKLRGLGVEFFFAHKVLKLEDSNSLKKITLQNANLENKELEVELVLAAAGFKPNVELAQACGIEVGPTGGIKVSRQMVTSDPDIYAIGDVVEGWDIISQKPSLAMKADNAVRTGRVAALHLSGNPQVNFSGTVGGMIIYLGGLFIGAVGYTEEAARSLKGDKVKVIDHEGMTLPKYLGGVPVRIKLVYAEGLLLGAQIVSNANISGELDKIALVISEKISVEKLRGTEIVYTPASGWPYGPMAQALDKVR